MLHQPKLVKTLYECEDLIVAEAVVIEAPYLADATGQTDCTAAIQAALDDVLAKGGGTVYLPAGKYLVTDSIFVPRGCALIGDWQCPDTTDALEYGTVLLVRTPVLDEAYLADRTRDALICLDSCSSVEGITFYYPDQDIRDVKKYGYTIYCQTPSCMSVSRVTLLNSYRGIGVCVHHEQPCELVELENVYMTALEVGLEHYHSSEVGYIVNFHMSPRYWAGAGSGFACSDAKALRAYCRENTVGMQINGLDDTHLCELELEGLRTAIYMPTGYAGHYFWGLLYQVDIRDCQNGIVVEALNGMGGAAIAHARIEVERAAICNSAPSGTIKLCDVHASKGDIVAVDRARMYQDDTDVSGYKIAHARYEKPAEHLYIVPADALSDIKQDASPLIQQTLDEAGKTGGIVYLAAGVYSIYHTLRVPTGVELRGATPFFVRDSFNVADGVQGTVLLTYVPDDATVLLAERAGVNGLRVFCGLHSAYRARDLLRANDPIVEKQCAIKGTGRGVYAHNVVLTVTFNGIDFRGCDHHSVKQAFGAVYRHFVLASGKGGVVEQVLTNQHFLDRQHFLSDAFLNTDYYDGWAMVGGQGAIFRDEVRRSFGVTVYLEGAENESVSNVFTYGAYTLILCDHTSATLLNVSADFQGVGPMFDIKNGSRVTAVNVLRSANESMLCDESSDFKLINRTAISRFNEPSFDSANGHLDELSYEVTDRVMINDGSLDADDTEGYVGDEFAKTDNTSRHHAPSTTGQPAVVLYEQHFDTIDLDPYMTDDGYLHLWVYVKHMLTSVWTGNISLLGDGNGISWSTICYITHDGWNELWLPMTGTAGVTRGLVNRLKITDVRRGGSVQDHSDYYFDDIYLCHAKNDRVPTVMPRVPSYEVSPLPRKTVAPIPTVTPEGDVIVLTCDSLKGNKARSCAARVVHDADSVKEGTGAWRLCAQNKIAVNVAVPANKLTTGELCFWLRTEHEGVLNGTVKLTLLDGEQRQELLWTLADNVTDGGWHRVCLPWSEAQETSAPRGPVWTSTLLLSLEGAGTVVAYLDDVRITGAKQ
ncbi:MAG: hypothetical protein IIX15_01835 [Clostridia bacterium]|nr:hypothetical protein [Clostridia bacterium]